MEHNHKQKKKKSHSPVKSSSCVFSCWYPLIHSSYRWNSCPSRSSLLFLSHPFSLTPEVTMCYPSLSPSVPMASYLPTRISCYKMHDYKIQKDNPYITLASSLISPAIILFSILHGHLVNAIVINWSTSIVSVSSIQPNDYQFLSFQLKLIIWLYILVIFIFFSKTHAV